MKVLFFLEDFTPDNSVEELVVTAIAVFILLWIIEWTALLFLNNIKTDICQTSKDKTILARHTMDFIAMASFSYFGFQAFTTVGLDVYSSLKVGILDY